jgi:hypothetical protein
LARRLNFSGYDGSRPVAIPDVPAPLRGAGKAHSLALILEIALDHCGLTLGYDAIMGLCELAFRTPPWPRSPEADEDDATAAVSALSDALGGCMTVAGHDESDEDAILRAVATAVDAGRPCAAFGWGSEKERWSVIAGYDRGKGRLLGHCLLDAPRMQYESWPPALRMLVAITSDPEPRGPRAVDDALQSGAARVVGEGAERLAAWVSEMRLIDGPPGPSHERAVELLADARAAAAGFAERVAAYQGEIAAAWLARAAERWRELVMLLEARGLPHSREAAEALEEPQGRADWAELLESAARLDDAAATAVRASTSADYPPEEARSW